MFDRLNITMYLVGILLAVSLIAGAYPAYYASRFQPTEILKGKLKLIGSNALSRTLLTWQFGFSIMAIFCGIVLSQNAKYQKDLDWGFDKENALVIPLHEETNYPILKNALNAYSNVESVAGTMQNLSYSSVSGTIEIDGIAHESEQLFVGDNYLQTVGCELLNGRFFELNSVYDQGASVIVNEKFLTTFNIKDPLNQSIYDKGKKVRNHWDYQRL